MWRFTIPSAQPINNSSSTPIANAFKSGESFPVSVSLQKQRRYSSDSWSSEITLVPAIDIDIPSADLGCINIAVAELYAAYDIATSAPAATSQEPLLAVDQVVESTPESSNNSGPSDAKPGVGSEEDLPRSAAAILAALPQLSSSSEHDALLCEMQPKLDELKSALASLAQAVEKLPSTGILYWIEKLLVAANLKCDKNDVLIACDFYTQLIKEIDTNLDSSKNSGELTEQDILSKVQIAREELSKILKDPFEKLSHGYLSVGAWREILKDVWYVSYTLAAATFAAGVLAGVYSLFVETIAIAACIKAFASFIKKFWPIYLKKTGVEEKVRLKEFYTSFIKISEEIEEMIKSRVIVENNKILRDTQNMLVQMQQMMSLQTQKAQAQDSSQNAETVSELTQKMVDFAIKILANPGFDKENDPNAFLIKAVAALDKNSSAAVIQNTGNIPDLI